MFFKIIRSFPVTFFPTLNCDLISMTFFHFFFCDFFPIIFNLSQNKPWFLTVCSCRTSLLKTLWEKEKLLLSSNFSFSHSIFYLFGELSSISVKYEIVDRNFFQFGRVQSLLFGKGLRLKGWPWAT